ncbi:MAG TPA: Holliday junction branch migration protein RuvA [Candidatus Paceibacterota bacterium]|nr:Holliday junction branch migration protein RuvA [Candidatus Paceibacterota bacterium]
MIHSVSGKLIEKRDSFAVIEVLGVGIKLTSHRRALSSMPPVGSQVKLFSHLHVREDLLDLYGFPTEEELNFFELLISVSGVGPKSALAILEISELKELAAAIQENRPDLLTRASGIGRKTAERIIIDLKTKVKTEMSSEAVKRMESDADIVETLTNLGYRRDEAKVALQKVGKDVTGLEPRLKEALKILGKK